MKQIKLTSLLFLLLLISCDKDLEDTATILGSGIDGFEQEVEMVTASVVGFVVDENEQPIPDATIRYSGGQTATDDYGHFFIENQSMNARSMIVDVSKDGFFNGNRRFFPVSGEESRIKISLLEKRFDQSFLASSGGSLAFEAGGQVVFAPNSIGMEDGTEYAGEVRAAIRWLDPTDLSTFDRMPGSLQGVSAQNEEMALVSFGMVAVELQDMFGIPLNLLEDQVAELRIPIPIALLTNSPQSIPLWSFYPEYGLWSEESEAQLENGFYVGSVPHFSFWNCDVPYELIDFKARIIDVAGNPISNIKAVIQLSNTNAASGASNGDGIISGKIPANEQLTLKLFDQCGGIFYTQSIGPFSDDIDMGDISVVLTTNTITHVSGALLDCNTDPVTKGLVIFEFENTNIYEYINDSNFDISFITCPSTEFVNVIVVNLNGLKQNDGFEVSAGISTDVGTIKICDNQLENYIQIIIDDSTYTQPLSWVGTNYIGGTQIISMNFNLFEIELYFNGLTSGDYSTNNLVNHFIIYGETASYVIKDTLSHFEVTKFVDDWDEVEGYFGGVLTDTAMIDVNVSGSFYWKKE